MKKVPYLSVFAVVHGVQVTMEVTPSGLSPRSSHTNLIEPTPTESWQFYTITQLILLSDKLFTRIQTTCTISYFSLASFTKDQKAVIYHVSSV